MTVRLSLAAAATGAIIAAGFLRFWLFPFAWIAFVPLLWALPQEAQGSHSQRLHQLSVFMTPTRLR